MQKLEDRKTDTQDKKHSDFIGNLEHLFGIAHAIALELIKIEEHQ